MVITWGTLHLAKMVENGGTTVTAALIALGAAWLARQGVRETNEEARLREQESRKEVERVRQDELRRHAYLEYLEAYEIWADLYLKGDDINFTVEQDFAFRSYQKAVLNVRLITRDAGVLDALDIAADEITKDSDPFVWTHRINGRNVFIEAVLKERESDGVRRDTLTR